MIRKVLGLGLVFVSLASTALASPPLPGPEIDAGSMASGLTLLIGGLLLFKDRCRRS